MAARSHASGGTGTPVPPLILSRSLFPRALRLLTGWLVMGVPALLMFLLVLYPLMAIIIQSVLPHLFGLHPKATVSLHSLDLVFTNQASYRALVFSCILAVVTAVGSSVLGTALAVIVSRTDTPGRAIIDTIVWVIFFTPSFILGEAWTVVMVRGGTLDQYVHLPTSVISTFFSPVGVAMLLILKGFPFVYFAVRAALVWLGSEYEDAARIAGARQGQAWLRINIPLLLPAILSGALITLAEALSDFGTAATIAQHANVPLVTFQIYEAINTFPVNFSLAAALSLLLFLAIVAALVGQSRLTRVRSFQVISGRTHTPRTILLGRWKWLALAAVILIALVALVIPLGECVLLSFQQAFGNGLNLGNLTVANYRTVLANGAEDRASLATSIRLAFAAATVVTLLGLPIAFLTSRTRLPGRQILGFATLVTISVPGIILASGYIFAWNSPYLQHLGIGGSGQPHFYGTIWVLLAAYIGGTLPYAIRLNMGALDQISDALVEAARVQGAGIHQLLVYIVAPILRSGLLSIWLLVFTGTMFELAASELLYPPGNPTMPVRIISYFNDFKVERGMALAMLNIAIVVLFVAAIRIVLWLGSARREIMTKERT